MRVWLKKMGIVFLLLGHANIRAMHFDTPLPVCAFKRSLDVCMQIASELKACEHEQIHHNAAYPTPEFHEFLYKLFKEFSSHVAYIDKYSVYNEDIQYLARIYVRTCMCYKKIFSFDATGMSSCGEIFPFIDEQFHALLTPEQPLPLRFPQE